MPPCPGWQRIDDDQVQLIKVDGALVVEAAVRRACGRHVAKENDLLLPALTRSGASLAALLADMHESQARVHV